MEQNANALPKVTLGQYKGWNSPAGCARYRKRP